MENQFLFSNIIVLTIGTLTFVVLYVIFLVKIARLFTRNPNGEYDGSDKIISAAIILSSLNHLSLAVPLLYQILNQFKYTFYNGEFTVQVLNKASIMVLLSMLYSIAAMLIAHLTCSFIFSKKNKDIDIEPEISHGLTFTLVLIGSSLLSKEHLIVLLNTVIQDSTIPLFN